MDLIFAEETIHTHSVTVSSFLNIPGDPFRCGTDISLHNSYLQLQNSTGVVALLLFRLEREEQQSPQIIIWEQPVSE